LSLRRLLAGYLLVVLYLCLYPWDFRWDSPSTFWSWRFPAGRGGYVDAVLNLGLLAPAGLLAGLAARTRWHWLWALMGAGVFAALVEWLQAYLPTRNSSGWDLLFNVTGAGLGWALATAMAPLWGARRLQVPGRIEDPRPLFLLALFVLAQAFPFIPRIRLTQAKEWIAALGTRPDLLVLVSAYVSWLAASVILNRVVEGRLPAGMAPALLLVLLLGRAAFPAGIHAGLSILASVAGIFVGALLPWRSTRRWLGWAMLSYVAFRQFYPFSFSGGAQPVLWIPFDSILQLRTEHGLRILFEKSFVYAATVWLLAQRPLGLVTATALCATVLAVGELGQQWIPGRTPDSLDVCLALLAGVTLAAMARRSHKGQADRGRSGSDRG
jgi:VanZ family protein